MRPAHGFRYAAEKKGLAPLRWVTRHPSTVLACGIGIVLGLGWYTFDYGEGLSYFSTDPIACANCHVMNDQYDSWTKAGHHQAAVCVDCHLPVNFIRKYIAKADNGFWHSKGFTFMDFHDPIMIKPRNARILQENCLRCHGEFVHQIVPGSRSKRAAAEGVSCVHCHRGAGHGARAGSGHIAMAPHGAGRQGERPATASAGRGLSAWVQGQRP